jgi:hypothetical protein
MPDNLLPPIARPGAYEPRNDIGVAGPERAASASGPAAPAASAKPAPAPEHPAAAPAMQNVRLHFKVDPETHDVTVLLVDTASKRVVRTIPPEELQKLNEGDLVELLA